jgi:hypothetical protein
MRESGLVATSDEHKTAKGAARAGKPIWKRTVKSALKAKLDQWRGLCAPPEPEPRPSGVPFGLIRSRF